MNHLRQELSPVLPRAYEMIAARAREVLEARLAARKLVDFDGPRGYEFSAVSLGRSRPIQVGANVQGRLRLVQPLLELRVPFELSLADLDDVDRGADDIELDPVAEAARKLADLEDKAVFYGVEAAGITGLLPSSTQPKLTISPDLSDFTDQVSAAIAQLHAAGVAGPYAIALDEPSYAALLRSTGPGGYPTLNHVRKLVDGPSVFAPSLSGALVISLRGGDFKLTVGQDASIGYLSHDSEKVRLYLEETLTFRSLTPEAVVQLPLAAAR
jgi:uncharacterized linocin/CFP29 family protein